MSSYWNPVFRRAWLALGCVAALPSLHAQTHAKTVATADLAALRRGFQDPPPQARMRCYWWWLNGHTDKPTITHDLEEMKRQGFGGALLVDANGSNQLGNQNVPAGPLFGSPAWVELYKHALAEADRLGLEITFNITSGWNLGGPDVTPEQASKLLTWTRTEVTGGAPAAVQLAAPVSRNSFYRQIAVLAYPLAHGDALAPQPDDAQGDRYTQDAISGTNQGDSRRAAATLRFRSAAAETGFSMPDASAMLNDGVHGKYAPFAGDPTFADTAPVAVQDVSSQVSPDGRANLHLPAGQWELLRIGYTDSGAKVSTSSGAWQGLAIDYMSREAFLAYWNHTVEPLLAVAKPYHSLKYLATDSWELGGTNWTGDFRAKFQRLRGYDPVPWLPVVAGRIVGDRAQSTRFLADLRRTVGDLIATEHYDVFAEKAAEHGMGVEAESGGPHGAPIDALETFRRAAVPQSEFWSENAHRNTDPERFFTKEAASAVNIYGRRFVAEEGETSIGPQWSESLATDLKPTFDMGVTEGLNRLVWHQFTSSPASTGLPGQEYFAGTHLNPKVTWWNAGAAFFTYLNRVQFLMQQGTPADDVLYFYGDNVPSFVRLKADDPAHVLPGFDYDVTDEDALLHTIRIDGAQLVGPATAGRDGVRWRLLAMPNTARISMPVLQLVERFVRGGGSVVGPAPASPTGLVAPAAQAHFDALAAKLWTGCTPGSSHRYGSGTVFCGADAHAALRAMKIAPDFKALPPAVQKASSSGGVDYIHRRLHGADLYFVRNASSAPIDFDAAFRVTGTRAEQWDPVTGEMMPLNPAVTGQGAARETTVLPLHLPAFGSMVVVFSPALPHSNSPSHTAEALSRPLALAGPWTLSFQSGRGGPPGSVPLTELASWTASPDPRVRYFSGTATYSATVEAPVVARLADVALQFTQVREIARVRINGMDAGTVWAAPYRLRVGRLLHAGANRIEIQVTNLWPNRMIGDLQPGVTEPITSTNITTYKVGSPLLPSGLIGPIAWIEEEPR